MFYQPRQIEEALALRGEMGADVTPVGGGTDLVAVLNGQTSGPKHVLDLTQVEGYSDVVRVDGGWEVAGGATFGRLGRMPVRALAEAAMTVGGAAIRNRGTLAGNLATASPAGDGCVALLALDAEVVLSHARRGGRVVPIDAYFTGFKQTALLADELITRVRFRGDWRTGWRKIGKRGATNISIVCCAVGLSAGGAVRIAFGSVAPTVMRAKRAEAIAAAGGLSDEAIEAAAAAAMEEVSPIDDHRASAAYRRAMCGVLVRRLLRDVKKSKSQKVKKSKRRSVEMQRLTATPQRCASQRRNVGTAADRDIAGIGEVGDAARFLVAFTLNGGAVEVEVGQDETLLSVLRDKLGLTGTKGACLEGECGSCTVIVDGQAVNSCLMLAGQVRGCRVETIEGLAREDKLHVLQEEFLASGAVQCGYCTPGLIMAAKALLDVNPNPTEEELLAGMEGNLCRCTGYGAIREAIRAAVGTWG
jgi:carbon-monoxide dehydrogenase medium subunit